VIARFRIPALLIALALVAGACAETEPPPVAYSGDLQKGNPPTPEEVAATILGEAPEATDLSADQQARLDTALAESPAGCEMLDTSSCMLPFPSDALTEEDPDSATNRRVNLPEGQLANEAGTTLDPTTWNTLDGFSPSTPIVVYVPGIDAEATNLPSETEIGESLTEESPTVLVDLDTGQLVPHWAEMDSQTDDPARKSLIIHPATSLLETHRIGVALRNIVGTNGVAVPAPVQFQVLRDNYNSDAPQFTDIRDDYDVVFNELAEAGVERQSLYLAWWFTVGSAESLAGNVLSMRDDAMGALNGSAPAFSINAVRTDDLEDGIARVVEGTFEVPLYLENDQPGSVMSFDDAGEPTTTGTITADFVCTIPDQATDTGEARPVVYGHGLLGTADEAASSHVQVTAAEANLVYCSTDALGLSEGDVGFVAQVLGDISKFPAVADRLQQAILNYLYLGRLMVNVDGLGSAEEFMTDSGANMLNTDEAYWDGNSQGAILGGAVTAVAQDWTKAVLGVGGMGYATLLNRSVDFQEYFAIMRQAYPDPIEQQVIYGVMQMLWDRGETAGYVQHLTTRPYDLTPPHTVLMTVAFGDHQVANITADTIARSLGIEVYKPELPEGADDVPADDRFWDLDGIEQFPHEASALYYWYSGTLPPPNGNITPVQGPLYAAECSGAAAETEVKCMDPHEDPRRQQGVRAQKDAFFQPDGVIINVCDDEPCEATPRSELDY